LTSTRLEQPRSSVVFTPLALERFAIRGIAQAPGISVVRTGMGPERAKRAAREVFTDSIKTVDAIAVLGFCGALVGDLQPGAVVVADAVTTSDRSHPCAGAGWIADKLRRAGVTATRGVVHCTDHIVRGNERAELAAQGAIAVDMESAWLAPDDGIPFAVVRTVVDTPEREITRPWKTVTGGLRAYRSLGVAGRIVRDWLKHLDSLGGASGASDVSSGVSGASSKVWSN
jgi:4-hydroxy-3-methylbut-2-en-1-yl diphosphate reductase